MDDPGCSYFESEVDADICVSRQKSNDTAANSLTKKSFLQTFLRRNYAACTKLGLLRVSPRLVGAKCPNNQVSIDSEESTVEVGGSAR
jgi:hypothetical protein